MNKKILLLCLTIIISSCTTEVKNEKTIETVEDSNIVNQGFFDKTDMGKEFIEKHNLPMFMGKYKYYDYKLVENNFFQTKSIIINYKNENSILYLMLSEELSPNKIKEGIKNSFKQKSKMYKYGDGIIFIGQISGGLIWYTNDRIKYLKIGIQGKNHDKENIMEFYHWFLKKYPPNLTKKHLEIDDTNGLKELRFYEIGNDIEFLNKYNLPNKFGTYKFNNYKISIIEELGMVNIEINYKHNNKSLMVITLSKDLPNNKEEMKQAFNYFSIPLQVENGLVLKSVANGGLVWFSKGNIKYIKYSAENYDGLIEGEDAKSFTSLVNWLLLKFPPNYTQEYLEMKDISKYRKLNNK